MKKMTVGLGLVAAVAAALKAKQLRAGQAAADTDSPDVTSAVAASPVSGSRVSESAAAASPVEPITAETLKVGRAKPDEIDTALSIDAARSPQSQSTQSPVIKPVAQGRPIPPDVSLPAEVLPEYPSDQTPRTSPVLDAGSISIPQADGEPDEVLPPVEQPTILPASTQAATGQSAQTATPALTAPTALATLPDTDTQAADKATVTSGAGVASDPDVASEKKRIFPKSAWGIAGSLLLGLVIVAAIAASFIKLPYYRFDPGSVYDTVDRVSAPEDLVFAPEDGNIGFVTVAQTSDVTVLQWLDAKLDSGVRLEHEDLVEGDQTAEEVREEDRRRMQLSKNDAVVVALDKLGYDLVITPLGIEVADIFPCTGAEGVLGTGDLIVGLNGADVREIDAFTESLGEIGIGEEVELLVERIDPNNPTQSIATELVNVTLGSADDSCLPDDIRAEEPRPFIGIQIFPIFDEQLPVQVDIETGRVGGPSAGLAFTLAILDVMSDGELTNGLNVVVTGVIRRDGSVAPVGGIHQKTIAAERSGADVFIVPACCDNFVDPETGDPLDVPTNYEEALMYTDDMMIIGVNTLDEAIEALVELGGSFPEQALGG